MIDGPSLDRTQEPFDHSCPGLFKQPWFSGLLVLSTLGKAVMGQKRTKKGSVSLSHNDLPLSGTRCVVTSSYIYRQKVMIHAPFGASPNNYRIRFDLFGGRDPFISELICTCKASLFIIKAPASVVNVKDV